MLLVSVAVSAAPVTVQDGALNVSGNFWVNLNKLFVDSGGGNVGIGTSSPSAKLEVSGAIKATDWNNVTITGSQVTNFNTLVSSVVNDTTDLINNNSDAVLRFLNVTSGITVGSPSKWVLNTTELSPVSDNQGNLGSFPNRFANLYFIRGRFNVTSEAPDYAGAVLIRGKEALRILGFEGSFLHGGQINFGDANYAYIKETNDDLLEIRGNAGIVLNSTTTKLGIVAGTGSTDYVCVSNTGVLSAGNSCTKFENLNPASGTMSDDDFMVTKIIEQRYPQNFPNGAFRGKVYNYIYTVEFNLLGQKMSGQIKIPGNMDKGEIPYALKSQIEEERGIKSIQEVEVQNEMLKSYKISEITSISEPQKSLKGGN